MAEHGNHPGLTSSRYWDAERRPGSFEPSPDKHMEPYLKDILPMNDQWTCLEIGVMPGNMLLWFARTFHYRPYGIDFSQYTNELEGSFQELGYDATFYQEDFVRWHPDQKFNVVYSCGFIEHFKDYQAIVLKHWTLVKEGGFLIISTPALTPIQRGVRKLLYTEEHYERMLRAHNLEAMKLSPLRKTIEAFPGSTIIAARYIREMAVWIRPGQKGLRENTVWIFPIIRFFEAIFKKHRISSPLFSPQILVVAKKAREAPEF